MGVGSQGSMTYGAGSIAAVAARFLYFRDDHSALLKAGLSSMTDTPIAISWLGAVYSVTEFAAIIGGDESGQPLGHCCIFTVTWGPESPPFKRN